MSQISYRGGLFRGHGLSFSYSRHTAPSTHPVRGYCPPFLFRRCFTAKPASRLYEDLISSLNSSSGNTAVAPAQSARGFPLVDVPAPQSLSARCPSGSGAGYTVLGPLYPASSRPTPLPPANCAGAAVIPVVFARGECFLHCDAPSVQAPDNWSLPPQNETAQDGTLRSETSAQRVVLPLGPCTAL